MGSKNFVGLLPQIDKPHIRMTFVAPAIGILVIAIISGLPRPAAAIDELTIAGVRGLSEDEAGTVILTEAYRRIGIKLKIKRLPAKRAIVMTNQGKFDGDLQRIDAVKNLYKNLVQVRPPINFLEASAFTVGLEFPINGWDSLRPHRIGIIRGIKFAEVNTKGMNRVLVSDYDALFKMLKAGRVDVAVLPRVNGLFQLTKFGFDDIRDLKPALLRIDLFHYLHRKNSHLLPRLSAVIEDMRDKGELIAMRERATEVLLTSAASGRKD